MRLVLLTIFLLTSGAAPVLAQTSDTADGFTETPLACLRSRVVIAEPTADRRTLTFTVRNDLDWALSGVRIEHRVQSADRSVPWVDTTAAIPVPGGIEPGETRTVSVGFAPIPSEFSINDLDISVTILDVADAEKRLFQSSVRVTGWSRAPSPNTCG